MQILEQSNILTEKKGPAGSAHLPLGLGAERFNPIGSEPKEVD